MEILSLRATVGPCVYSIEHAPLIIARVSLTGATDTAFRELGERALELQARVTGFQGQVLTVQQLSEGLCNVVFHALTEEVGRASLTATLQVFQGAVPESESEARVRKAFHKSRHPFSTQALLDEATARGIPHLALNKTSLVQLGYGCHQQRVQDTVTEFTSLIGRDLAESRWECAQMLRAMDMPVPDGELVDEAAGLEPALARLGYPVALKPSVGHQREGVTPCVKNEDEARAAYVLASRFGSPVLVEAHVRGDDYRVLVVDYRFVAASLSKGGGSTDVTDEVHPENIHLFERAAHFIGLDVAGLHVVADDLRAPLRRSGGRIIRVTAAPEFRTFLTPASGPPRNVAAPVIDKLFPQGTPSRVPILAVTGTNGKTTTTRLLAHLLQRVGSRVGFTSSDGIYMGAYQIRPGDLTDEFAAWTVLKDPWVDTAVFEYPRGGLVRAGLGFDACDVAVVTNVSADHLGLGDIHTMEEMAQVKAVVVKSVRPGGHAVLNADDDRVFAMRLGLRGEVALFSLRPDSPRLAEAHVTAVLDDGKVVLRRGQWRYPVARTVDIPVTFGGRAAFMIQNVLAASLAAFCHGLSPAEIRGGLVTFDPGYAQTPGRMNYFYGNGFRVLVDYAHNLDSMVALSKYLDEAESSSPRVGVLGGTGDRRDADILELGRQAGRMFQRLVIREDRDTRGRAQGETAELVRLGALQERPDVSCEVLLDSAESVRRAIRTARAGELVCVLGGDVQESLGVVRGLCRPTR